MPERLEKLQTALTELEKELHNLQSVDEEKRVRLEEMVQNIQAGLEKQDIEKIEPETLTERLKDAVGDFEASHPTLAGVLNRMIDILGQAGI